MESINAVQQANGPATAEMESTRSNGTSLSDDQILTAMYDDPNRGIKLKKLWNGYYDSYFSNRYKASLSLCKSLCYLTQRNPVRMDMLYRQSGLYRKKFWDDHGEEIIKKVCQSCKHVYSPPKLKPKRTRKKPSVKLEAAKAEITNIMNSGPLATEEIISRALAAGHSRGTVLRAMSELPTKYYRLEYQGAFYRALPVRVTPKSTPTGSVLTCAPDDEGIWP